MKQFLQEIQQYIPTQSKSYLKQYIIQYDKIPQQIQFLRLRNCNLLAIIDQLLQLGSLSTPFNQKPTENGFEDILPPYQKAYYMQTNLKQIILNKINSDDKKHENDEIYIVCIQWLNKLNQDENQQRNIFLSKQQTQNSIKITNQQSKIKLQQPRQIEDEFMQTTVHPQQSQQFTTEILMKQSDKDAYINYLQAKVEQQEKQIQWLQQNLQLMKDGEQQILQELLN